MALVYIWFIGQLFKNKFILVSTSRSAT